MTLPMPFELAIIRRLKEEEGWTHAQLARKYLCSEATISRWLAEDRRRRAARPAEESEACRMSVPALDRKGGRE